MLQKAWSVVLLNKKILIHLSQVYYVRQVVKTPTVILNNSVFKTSVCQNMDVGGRKRRSVRIWVICLCASVV